MVVVDGGVGLGLELELELELITDEEVDTTLDDEESTEDDGFTLDDGISVEDDGATVEDWLSVAEDATEEDTLTEDSQRPNSGLQPAPQ